MSPRRVIGVACAAIALTAGACVRAPSATPGVAPAETESHVTMLVASPASTYPSCPAAALGARTEVSDVEGGVVVDVTGNDDATSDAIHARAQALLAVAARDAGGGNDADGPGVGRCPIVLHGTRVSAAPIDRGVRFVVLTRADAADWLRHETRLRLLELGFVPVSTAKDEGSCPSALPSAMTDVRDASDGVIVRVFSRDPDVAEAIRGRAWHLMEEARRGEVDAGGERAPAEAACPAVVRAGVEVIASDVPGGVEITLRAQDREQIEELRREVRERARRFR
jgi:hypothetical protein